MRLKEFELIAIRETFKQFFLTNDLLWLFGSRVDDTQRGGDIDLYIETEELDARTVLNKQIDFLVALKRKIGDQKIDVVIKRPNLDLAIYTVAKETGIRLV